MKLEKNHVDQITIAFNQMQSREELLHLLNIAKPFIYGDKAVRFQLKQLTFYTFQENTKKAYKEFQVKKKSGGYRTIYAPQKGLKALQKTLNLVLQCVFEPHKAAMGFVKGKSIVDNAKIHQGNNYVYNIDLKDFFLSIDQARVWSCLKLKPFNLVDTVVASDGNDSRNLNTGIRRFKTEFKEQIFYKIQDNAVEFIDDNNGNYSRYKKRLTSQIIRPESQTLKNILDFEEHGDKLLFEDAKKYILTSENIEQLTRLISSRKSLANIITALCCVEMDVERKNESGEWEVVKRKVIPQGAPTSPVLTNVVCQRLDYLLSAVAKRFGLKYSRYVDDITFSSMHNVYQENSEFLVELQRIIANQGFHIKESKTRLQKHGFRQEVTGLVINEKANVQKRYIKQLRMWLYYWEKYGYERANHMFINDYIADKGHVKMSKPNMINVIGGKLDYLKMVKGEENTLYMNLKKRYEKLISNFNPIIQVIDLWEKEGIEVAMNKFYENK